MRFHASLSIALCASIARANDLPPVPFELNVGADAGLYAFRAPLLDGGAFVTARGEIVYALPARNGSAWSLVESFSDGCAQPFGSDESAGTVTRLLGDDMARWTSGAPTFGRVELGCVWPGVRVDLAAREGSVEKRFLVAPGASTGAIRMRVAGACSLSVRADGVLLAETGLGDVEFSAPIAWQVRAGEREPVAVAYRVDGDTYSFALGAYDATRELVIDPLIQSTYAGGSDLDHAFAVAVDAPNNRVYVGGESRSVDFPGVSGGAQSGGGGFNYDAFLASFSLDLSTRHQSTYFGGVGDTRIDDVVVGSSSVYVCGRTGSNDLPGVASGVDPTFAFWTEGFVARFDPSLTTLMSSTYLGGTETSYEERANALVIDPTTGNVYVSGTTNAPDFPGAVGSANTTIRAEDAYVARLDATLQSALRTCFLGGTNNDTGEGLARNPATGAILVTGNTFSDDLRTYTTLAGGAIATSSYNVSVWTDVYVVSIDSQLTSFLGSTYLSTLNVELVEDIVLDGAGNVFVAGVTNSAWFLPGTSGAAQPSPAGEDDGFATRFSPDLTSLFRTTYVGGSGSEWGYSLALHPSGDILFCGSTTSTTFPSTTGGAFPFDPGTWGDGFIARIAPTLATFVQNTFYGAGGSSSTAAYALAVQPLNGDVYVAGETGASDFPGRAGGAQGASGGSTDGIVSVFDATLTGPVPTPASYCTTSTTTHGCAPSIAASAHPDVAMTTPCTITVTQLEGQVSSVIFYSVTGRMALPWCGGSASYLCIAPPRQRLPVQSSGGTLNGCNGSLSADWNAWAAGNPTMLGMPMYAGEVIDCQAWFRDPSACKTTNLTDAVELVVQP